MKPEWFDSAHFPQASFQSTAIKASGAGKFDVGGKLVIKGWSQDAVVPVVLTQSGGQSVASGSFTLKRLAFKIGAGEWADPSLVADDVVVKFKLTLAGMPPL
jgi:polyisoprenoid-binding protein YceI